MKSAMALAEDVPGRLHGSWTWHTRCKQRRSVHLMNQGPPPSAENGSAFGLFRSQCEAAFGSLAWALDEEADVLEPGARK